MKCPHCDLCILYSPDSPTCKSTGGIYGGRKAGCATAFELGANKKKGRPTRVRRDNAIVELSRGKSKGSRLEAGL